MKLEASRKNNAPSKLVNIFENKNVVPYIYILPILTFLAVFILKPFIFAIIKSFYRYDGFNTNVFIGLDNYIRLFSDKKFYISLYNLLIFFIGFFIAFAVPIIVAELIFNLRSERLRNFFRTSLIMPMVIPAIIILLVWKFMYYPSIGLFSQLFEAIGIEAPNFLGGTAWVKPSIIMIGFPWVAGVNLLIIYAALQGIDQSVIEASKIEGLGAIKRVLKIDIPLIMPQIKTLLILGIIGQMQNYERLLILTQGGPNNASLVPGLYMYQVAFATDGSIPLFGYSCAMAVVLFLITLVITIFVLKEKRENN